MSERDTSGREAAHPLVERLLERHPAPVRLVLLGVGSGRNLPPLLAAGHAVDVVEPEPARRARATARFAASVASGRLRLSAGFDAGPPEAENGDAPLAAALLSTHGLLHGTPSTIRTLLDAARRRLRPGGELFATLGSRADPRFGTGRRIDDSTWAPESGAETGVAHAYFDEAGARALLGSFELLELTEASASESVGAWAHAPGEARTMRHWTAIGRLRPQAQ